MKWAIGITPVFGHPQLIWMGRTQEAMLFMWPLVVLLAKCEATLWLFTAPVHKEVTPKKGVTLLGAAHRVMPDVRIDVSALGQHHYFLRSTLSSFVPEPISLYIMSDNYR